MTTGPRAATCTNPSRPSATTAGGAGSQPARLASAPPPAPGAAARPAGELAVFELRRDRSARRRRAGRCSRSAAPSARAPRSRADPTAASHSVVFPNPGRRSGQWRSQARGSRTKLNQGERAQPRAPRPTRHHHYAPGRRTTPRWSSQWSGYRRAFISHWVCSQIGEPR